MNSPVLAKVHESYSALFCVAAPCTRIGRLPLPLVYECSLYSIHVFFEFNLENSDLI